MDKQLRFDETYWKRFTHDTPKEAFEDIQIGHSVGIWASYGMWVSKAAIEEPIIHPFIFWDLYRHPGLRAGPLMEWFSMISKKKYRRGIWIR